MTRHDSSVWSRIVATVSCDSSRNPKGPLESQPAAPGEASAALARVSQPEGCAEAQALLRRAAPALERAHPDHSALQRRLADAKALVLLTRGEGPTCRSAAPATD